MRWLGALVLVAGCTLDPRTVIDQAALRVEVDGVPASGTLLVLTVRDSAQKELIKRSTLAGLPSFQVIFEQGTVAPGTLDLGGVVLGPDGAQLACGASRAEGVLTATGAVKLALTLANDDSNCGGCGRTCPAPDHSVSACVKATASCSPFACASGWFDVNKDPTDGCETTCASPSPENTLATCRDLMDNDCDGKLDCADEQCAGQARTCNFLSCTGRQTWDCATDAWSACTANEGLENNLAACSDGLDNDCDGKKDCQDEACMGFTQSCTLGTCMGMQSWTCASQAWNTCSIDQGLESSAAACLDGKDNDCDGKTDCADDRCLGGAESTISACSDGKDNDCDGKTDCADVDCTNLRQACGGSGNICADGIKTWLCSVKLFSACVPYVSVPENTDLVCGDALDNDCDAKTDCADTGCLSKQCAAGKICCPNGSCSATCT